MKPRNTDKPQCFAYGCSKVRAEGSDFCAKDLKRLPEDMRDKEQVREAIVFLAKEDGYLVADPIPKRSKTITDL